MIMSCQNFKRLDTLVLYRSRQMGIVLAFMGNMKTSGKDRVPQRI